MAGKSASSAAEKAEMIRSLFENSSDLMHVVSDRGLHKLVNPAWKAVLGWDEAEVVGKPAIEFTHPEDREGVVERLIAMPPGGATRSISAKAISSSCRLSSRASSTLGDWLVGPTNWPLNR